MAIYLVLSSICCSDGTRDSFVSFYPLALKADAVIYLLYGTAWLPATPLLLLLCIAAGITIFASQATAVYEGTGAAGMHLRNSVIALFVAIPLLVIGAQYSIVVVAWLRIPAIAAMSLLHFSVLRRYAGIGPGRMVRALFPALLVTMGFALALQGLIFLEPADAARDPLILAAELLVAGAGYIVLLFVLRHPVRHELRRVATALFRR